MESSLDRQAQRQARLLRSFSFGSSVLGFLYVALAIFVFRTPLVALLTLIATLGVLLAPLTLRFTGSQRAAAYQLSGSILLPILIMSGMTVGLSSPALSWLAAIPLLAMALADRRSGILWAGITLAGLATLVALDHLHLLPNTQVPPAQLRDAAALTWTGLIGVVLVMALLCDKLQSDATQAIAQAHQELSAKNASLAERRDHLMAQVNSVTHRINNPLQYIMSNTEYLLMMLGPERTSPDLSAPERKELTSAMEELRRGVEKLREITGELTFSSQGQNLEPATADQLPATRQSARAAAQSPPACRSVGVPCAPRTLAPVV